MSDVRILQFGTGRLLRGLCGDLIARGGGDGSVVAVQSTGRGRAEQINAAGGAYTVRTRGVRDGAQIDRAHEVKPYARAFAADSEWESVLEVACDPGLSLIVSNVTEAGLTPNGEIPGKYPAVTFPGKLLSVLCARAKAFDCDPARAPVVAPCELVGQNGVVVREAVLLLADRFGIDATVRAWIADEVVFASTLVDRICTEPAGGGPLEVTVEPFAQWAIEASGAHAERVRSAVWFAGNGCEVVDDVTPLFTRKVRVLNGAHTAVVPLGLLLGHSTVGGVMGDLSLRGFVEAVLGQEIVPPLEAAGVPDVCAFAADVIDRFCNPFHEHHLVEIEKGSEAKVPIRLVPTIQASVDSGSVPSLLCVSLAGHLERGCIDASLIEELPGVVRDGVARATAAIAAGSLRAHIDELIG